MARWIRRRSMAVLCGFGLVGAPRPASIEAQTRPREAAGRSCESLASLALPNTRITLAERVAPGAFVAPGPAPIPIQPDYSRLPAFCRVAATISPVPGSEIKIEVWLPASGWNGKFVGVGNGGMSGAIWYFAMSDPLQLGYAVAGTNTGHDADQGDTRFAVGHPERLVDFGWRAVHEMTIKAKSIVTAHYGRAARRAYWVGCSSGGRQGLKEVQRFPADYDGVSAGAPANNWMPLMAYATQVQRVVSDSALALGPAQRELIKTSYLAVCDARDGVTDRVVDDPRGCAFDPRTLQCSSTSAAGCLTTAQVEAVRSLYAGVVNARTGETLMPGPTPGGEPAWGIFSPAVFPIGANYLRELVIRDPNWNLATLDVDRDITRALAEDTGELTTMQTDLRAFFRRGGKLLLWHGWTDAMIPASNTITYYERALAASGAGARQSMRLFMLPGVDHCSGGEGAFVVDVLGVIDAWVESGRAPDRILAQRPFRDRPPRTRAVCAFPQFARYRGEGNTDDEKNFECTRPKP